jgi:hypothetical protein
MIGWPYILIFVFTNLVILRYLYLLFIRLYAATPIQLDLNNKELMFVGVNIAYWLTYIIDKF